MNINIFKLYLNNTMSKLFVNKCEKYNNRLSMANNKSLLYRSEKYKNSSQLIGLKFNSPISKLWNDSIYSYEKNYSKLLPSKNKTMSKFIKGYFYMYDPLVDRSVKKKMSRRVRIRFKRLSKNRIFVNKSEIKHSNSQVHITYNTFNSNLINLLSKTNIKKIRKNRLKKTRFNKLNLLTRKLLLKKKIYRLLSKKIKFQLISYNNQNILLLLNYINKRNKIIKDLSNIQEQRKRYIHQIKKFYHRKIKIFRKLLIKLYYIFSKLIKNNLYDEFIIKNIFIILDLIYLYVSYKILKKKRKKIYYNKNLINFNKSKFTNSQLLIVKSFLNKIFKKHVEVNFVNLKYIYLDSNLLSESISIGLKKTKKSLLRKIRKPLNKVKLPYINKTSRIDFPYKKHKYLMFNKLENFNLLSSNVYVNNNNNKDSIDKLLNNIYSNSINNNLNNINNKYIHGITIQASGRLSKRLTASRSVKKINIIGGLKDRNSSVEALSSTMVRGNLPSNIQYTKLKSKTRNGSYGLKLLINNN